MHINIFGAKAKADVHHMVEKMIDVYKNRLASNDWLSDDTRQKAIVKLNTLGINVGYPDKLDPLYTKFVVDEDADLVTNDLNFTQISLKEHYDRGVKMLIEVVGKCQLTWKMLIIILHLISLFSQQLFFKLHFIA